MKEKTKKEFQRLKRFGITGVLRVILACAGSVFVAIVATYFIQLSAVDNDTLVCITVKELPIEILCTVVFLEVAILLFIAFSFVEQGIRKLFGTKNAENFAENSFEILTDVENTDEEFEKMVEELRSEMKEKYSNPVEKEENISGKKAIAILVVVFLVLHGVLFYINYATINTFNEDNIVKRTLADPVGTTYAYSDIKEYTVEAEDCYPEYILKTKDGKKIEINYDNQNGFGDKYDDYYTALVKVDSLLKENNVPKTVKCTKDDFDEYEEEKEALDKILAE
jgi:uncharacterized membrane protein YphA (DoxX/SURF4 family)